MRKAAVKQRRWQSQAWVCNPEYAPINFPVQLVTKYQHTAITLSYLLTLRKYSFFTIINQASNLFLSFLSDSLWMKRKDVNILKFQDNCCWLFLNWRQKRYRQLFCRVSGLTGRNLAITEDLRVKSLLLQIERRQLRCFKHLTRIPPGWLSIELYPRMTHSLETLRQKQLA